MPVGPELPPYLQKRKRSTDNNESSPPAKIRAASPPPPRRILGPAPPPADLSERPSLFPSAQEGSDESSSDDDDFGPSLPPAPGSAAAHAAEAHAEREKEAAHAAATARSNEAAKPQRADWMLVPPSDSDWTGRVDPTKMKNRKFATGKGSKAPAEKSGISAIWTETPEQKRQRLEDEVLGRKDKAVNSKSSGAGDKILRDRQAEEDAAKARRVREYNEKTRGKSLMEEFESGAKGQKEKEDDPSKRAFDREKDMALGGQLGHAAKKDLLKKAGSFGDRFTKGTFS